jgi:type I restriction enzyme S subunit
MKLEWEIKKLKDVSIINYGYTESATSDPVGPRFLRITDIQNDCVDWDSVPFCKIETRDIPKYRLTSGDIVFARTGATTGKSFLVTDPPKAVFASYLIRLRLMETKLLPAFVTMFFQTAEYWKMINEGSSGSAQGGFNATKLGELSIRIPPLPEQQRIVAILDKAFDAIATAKANAEKNLQNARALFENVLQQMYDNASQKWESKNIDKICEIGDGNHGGNYPEKKDMRISGVPFIRSMNLVDGKISDEDMKYISEEKHNSLKKGHLKTGDVLYTNRGDIGKSAVVDCRFDDANLNSQIAYFRCSDQVLNWYLYYVLQSPQMKKHAAKAQTGAALQQLPISLIVELKVPLPPIDEQRINVSKLDNLRKETQHLESIYKQKIAALDELKKSLLQQAFNGEL